MINTNTEITQKLNYLVDTVNKYLSKNNVDKVKFFIAGGSVFSSINNTRFNDIDVYFYNEQDFLFVVENIDQNDVVYHTPNAITARNNDRTTRAYGKEIQFIRVAFGQPEELFKLFDINSCMCCIDSDYVIHKAPEFSNDIEINFENFKINTLQRYIKYVEQKNAKDNSNQLRKIIDYLVDHYEDDIAPGYAGDETTKGFNILKHYLEDYIDSDALQYVHDSIINKFKSSSVAVFSFLNMFQQPRNVSDEYKAYTLLKRLGVYQYLSFSPEEKRIRLKFAEYFI